MIVDVDSHFEPDIADPDEHPLRAFADQLPTLVDTTIEAVAGDLWNATPDHMRDDLAAGIPLLKLLRGEEIDAEEMTMVPTDRPPAAAQIQARLEWMDAVGVDFALINPGGYSGAVALRQWLRDRRDHQRAIRMCNDYLADWTEGHTHRVAPVSMVDFDDLAWSIEELERMRSRGSRAVMLSARPWEGRSPAHPEADRFWQAMSSLGMVGTLHIGFTPATFAGGWADAGWLEPGGTGPGAYLRFANSARIEAAQKFISSLVYGGTFERVPRATILLAELWVGWLPWFMARFEMLDGGSAVLGRLDLSLDPVAYIRRNVKATPLPGMHDDGMDVISDLSDMLVFSSDFPHTEGNADPINVYGDALRALPDDLRAAFLGGTMTEVFAHRRPVTRLSYQRPGARSGDVSPARP